MPKLSFDELESQVLRPENAVVQIIAAGFRKLFGMLGGGGAKMGGHTKTVDVTFSLDTSAYAAGDVLAESQVIAGCMRVANGTGVLGGFVLLDEDDQGAELDVVFLSENVSIGTENAAVAVSDAHARSVLGIVKVSADAWVDLGGARVATLLNVNVPVRPAADTNDVHVALVTRGTPTHSAGGIRGRFTFFQD